MKTISYTYMREHLTEVLDALRCGEEITVTQRGKVDVILNANLNVIPSPMVVVEHARKTLTPGESSGSFKGSRRDVDSLRSAAARGITDSLKKPRTPAADIEWTVLKDRGVHYQKSSQNGLSFSEAKERTKKRHAGVIKMLGDK